MAGFGIVLAAFKKDPSREFRRVGWTPGKMVTAQGEPVMPEPYVYYFDANGRLQMWLNVQTDILADDWELVVEEEVEE